MKIYVHEKTTKNADGDLLTVVQVYESKPTLFTYLIWI